MLCYKDTTFCIAPCSTECKIKLTNQVIEDARAWWGKASGDAPIAMSDYSDTCPAFNNKYKKENNEKI